MRAGRGGGGIDIDLIFVCALCEAKLVHDVTPMRPPTPVNRKSMYKVIRIENYSFLINFNVIYSVTKQSGLQRLGRGWAPLTGTRLSCDFENRNKMDDAWVNLNDPFSLVGYICMKCAGVITSVGHVTNVFEQVCVNLA